MVSGPEHSISSSPHAVTISGSQGVPQSWQVLEVPPQPWCWTAVLRVGTGGERKPQQGVTHWIVLSKLLRVCGPDSGQGRLPGSNDVKEWPHSGPEAAVTWNKTLPLQVNSVVA
jgi:hypothetical protein